MKRMFSKWMSSKPNVNRLTEQKWALNTVMIIGGFLVGAGVADCLMSLDHLDVDQLARGLTIFSAGVTICVLVDNTKAQKETKKIHLETQLQLKNIEEKLEAIYQSQQVTEREVREMRGDH
ncbi:hypothetical protein [Paenibacillus sp. DYY-L-2]|uniref:hypothetical protein n=1 Tax=Paenibacillus sp. DYY-L-2 TaxID=3447013 RepID=UPI003F506DF4